MNIHEEGRHQKQMAFFDEELAKAKLGLIGTIKACTWTVSTALIVYLISAVVK